MTQASRPRYPPSSKAAVIYCHDCCVTWEWKYRLSCFDTLDTLLYICTFSFLFRLQRARIGSDRMAHTTLAVAAVVSAAVLRTIWTVVLPAYLNGPVLSGYEGTLSCCDSISQAATDLHR